MVECHWQNPILYGVSTGVEALTYVGKAMRSMREIKMEITERIDRMDVIEDRLGISLQSFYATYHHDEDGGRVTVNFDVISPSGTLDQDLMITISIYNEKRQLIGASQEWINADDFMGIQSCSEVMFDIEAQPSLIRIIPKKS